MNYFLFYLFLFFIVLYGHIASVIEILAIAKNKVAIVE
jgi:hypothetical protein